MMMHFLYAVRFRNTTGLGKFEIMSMDAKARAAKVLHIYLTHSKGSTEPDALLVHIHRLMDTIICSKNMVEGHIGCLTDQVLCYLLMRPNNCFLMANRFMVICARTAHCFFDTISHTACLKLGGHKSYAPID